METIFITELINFKMLLNPIVSRQLTDYGLKVRKEERFKLPKAKDKLIKSKYNYEIDEFNHITIFNIEVRVIETIIDIINF